MGILLKVSGKTIKPMVLVFTHIVMELCMRDTGKTISKMVKAFSTGQIIVGMRDNSKMAKRMVKGSISGLMGLFILAIGSRISYQGMDSINGRVAEFTKDSG